MSDPAQRSRSESVVRHFLVAFVLAGLLYLVSYHGLEHLRMRKGGWHVQFAADTAGTPALIVSQPWLSISNVTLHFPEEQISLRRQTNLVVFDQPITNVPFGRVVYLDTTFLPGSVVFELFGHQIQLLPRVLMVDQREVPWQSGAALDLRRTNTVSGSPRPASQTGPR